MKGEKEEKRKGSVKKWKQLEEFSSPYSVSRTYFYPVSESKVAWRGRAGKERPPAPVCWPSSWSGLLALFECEEWRKLSNQSQSLSVSVRVGLESLPTDQWTTVTSPAYVTHARSLVVWSWNTRSCHRVQVLTSQQSSSFLSHGGNVVENVAIVTKI